MLIPHKVKNKGKYISFHYLRGWKARKIRKVQEISPQIPICCSLFVFKLYHKTCEQFYRNFGLYEKSPNPHGLSKELLLVVKVVQVVFYVSTSNHSFFRKKDVYKRQFTGWYKYKAGPQFTDRFMNVLEQRDYGTIYACLLYTSGCDRVRRRGQSSSWGCSPR